MGSSRSNACLSPPTIRQNPSSSPQIPPEVPASSRWTPCAPRILARSFVSVKRALPPSMITSPDSRYAASSVTVAAVMGPAGTITHVARGGSSLSTRSLMSVAAIAPDSMARSTALRSMSNATTSCPPRINLVVMPAPMRPRPTIPILNVISRPNAVANLSQRKSPRRKRRGPLVGFETRACRCTSIRPCRAGSQRCRRFGSSSSMQRTCRRREAGTNRSL